jgi:RNA polymerase sigma factor (sigma-70 family)
LKSAVNLSQLSTVWTDLHAAHTADAVKAKAAQERLLERYGPAIRRYLQGATRDTHAADDLSQEFAVRLVSGNFGGVSADRGRFRNFLKTVLYRLVVDWQRRQKRLAPSPEALGLPEPAAVADAAPFAEAEAEYLAACKQELFEQAWAGLKESEARRGKPLYAVLRLRTDQPDLRSADLANRLTAELGRPLTAGQVRKYLLEARDRLADGLVTAAALSLEAPTADLLAEDLDELGLGEYCRDALERWARARNGESSPE